MSLMLGCNGKPGFIRTKRAEKFLFRNGESGESGWEVRKGSLIFRTLEGKEGPERKKESLSGDEEEDGG